MTAGTRDTIDERAEDEGLATTEEAAATVYLRLVLSRVLRVRAAHDLAEAPIGNMAVPNLEILWCYGDATGSLQVPCSADLYVGGTSGVPREARQGRMKGAGKCRQEE